jgi:hypothetical protein
MLVEAGAGNEGALLALVAVAREYETRRGRGRLADEPAHDREAAFCRPDTSARRRRGASPGGGVGLADGERAAREIGHGDDGCGVADARPARHHERADREDALVQHADLADERHHHGREHDDRDPQEHVRDEQRLVHRDAPTAADARRAAARPCGALQTQRRDREPATSVSASIQTERRAAPRQGCEQPQRERARSRAAATR